MATPSGDETYAALGWLGVHDSLGAPSIVTVRLRVSRAALTESPDSSHP